MKISDPCCTIVGIATNVTNKQLFSTFMVDGCETPHQLIGGKHPTIQGGARFLLSAVSPPTMVYGRYSYS